MTEYNFSQLSNPTLGDFRAAVPSFHSEQKHGSVCVGSKGSGKGAHPLDNSPVCKFTASGKQFLLVYLDDAFIALSQRDSIAVYTKELPLENRPCNYIFVKWELSSGHAPQVAQGTGHTAEVPNIVSIEVTLPIHETTFSRGHVVVCVCVGNTFSMTTVSCRKKKSDANYPGYAFAQRLTEDEFNRHVPQQQPNLSLTTPQRHHGHPLGGSYANDQHPEDMDFSEHISSPSEGGVNDRTMSRDLSPEVTSRRKRLADDQDPCVNNLVVRYNLEANNLIIHGQIYHLSDARYKTDIRPLAGTFPNILELLKQIDPKVYKLATAPALGDTYGVLAQQVEKAFPGAVVTQPDGIKTISMGSLVAITIAAINQLASKVERFQATAAPALVTPPRLISPPTMGIDDAAMPWETFKTFRKNEVAEIEKYLSFDQAPTRARLIHIHGPPGIGKSTLIKLATKTLQDNYNVVIVLDCRSVSNLILSVTRAVVEAFGGTCDKYTHQDVFRTLVVDRASLDFRILLIFENVDVELAPYMADKPGLDVIFGSRKPEPSAIDSCEKPKPLPISCLSTDAAQSLFLHEASVDEKQLPEPEKAALRELVTDVLYGYPLSIAILGRIKRRRPQLELSTLLQQYKVKPDKIEEMAPKDPDDHALLPQRVFDLLIDSIKDDVFTADASLSACYIFSFLDRVISNDLVVIVAETIQAPPPPSQLEPPDWLTPLLSCCVCYQHVQDGNSFYNMHPVLQDAFRTRLKKKSDDGYKQALKRATNSVFNIAGEGYTRGQWETVALHVKAIWNVDSLSILADADIAARFVYLTLLLCTGVLNVEGDSVEKYTTGIKVIIEKHHLLLEEIEMLKLMARNSRRIFRHRDACTAMDKAIELYEGVPQAQQDPVKYLGMLRTQSFYHSRTDFDKARKLLDVIKAKAKKLCAKDRSTEHLACERDCEINRKVIIGWYYLVNISKNGIRNCEQTYKALDKAERKRDTNGPTEGPVREEHERQRAKTLLHMVHCRSNTIRYKTGSKCSKSDEDLMRRWLRESKELLLKYSSKGHYYTSNLRLMKARIEISLHNYEKAKRLLQKIVDTGRVALTKGTYGELVAVALLQQDYQEIAKWIDCIRRTVSCFRPDSALFDRLLGVQIHFYRLSQGALSIGLRDLFLFQSYLASVEIFCCVDESPPKTEEYLKRHGSNYQESRFLDQISNLRPLDNQPLIDGRLDKVIGFIKDSSATKKKPCKYFSAGDCKSGDKCTFLHDVSSKES